MPTALGDVDDASSSASPLERLREVLIGLEPSGANGFEGLAAHALSAVTGLVFRLARSGSQFGRDATSDPSPDRRRSTRRSEPP